MVHGSKSETGVIPGTEVKASDSGTAEVRV